MGRIAGNLQRVRDKIAAAAERSGRAAGDVELVVVTKERSIDEINEAIQAGAEVIGENRVQEAKGKYPQLRGRVSMHMIGHLQRNKVKDALKIFEFIHSVDSLKLAEEIERVATRWEKTVPVLAEVNVSGESSKFGLEPEELRPFLENVSGMKSLRVEGLMTMAPFVRDPEETRPVFARLRGLRDEINRLHLPGVVLRHLSMGMTQDYGIAVEEGATMVRVGSAIFRKNLAHLDR